MGWGSADHSVHSGSFEGHDDSPRPANSLVNAGDTDPITPTATFSA